jgi:putative Ca2+/H+ antiporter (TMEM165/GDT1 family)
MNLGVLLATFGLVLPAELPDKTFIANIVMASRHRPIPVWAGGFLALCLQAVIAVAAGRLLTLLPETAVHAVITALFLGGAAYLIFMPERKEEEKGAALAEESPGGEEAGESPERRESSHDEPPGWRVALTTFVILALAEFGDITQVLIANLAARYRSPVSVLVGAIAAFFVASGLGVLGGKAIVRVLPLSTVRRLSGIALLAFGAYELSGLV